MSENTWYILFDDNILLVREGESQLNLIQFFILIQEQFPFSFTDQVCASKHNVSKEINRVLCLHTIICYCDFSLFIYVNFYSKGKQNQVAKIFS